MLLSLHLFSFEQWCFCSISISNGNISLRLLADQHQNFSTQPNKLITVTKIIQYPCCQRAHNSADSYLKHTKNCQEHSHFTQTRCWKSHCSMSKTMEAVYSTNFWTLINQPNIQQLCICLSYFLLQGCTYFYLQQTSIAQPSAKTKHCLQEKNVFPLPHHLICEMESAIKDTMFNPQNTSSYIYFVQLVKDCSNCHWLCSSCRFTADRLWSTQRNPLKSYLMSQSCGLKPVTTMVRSYSLHH